MVLSPSALLTRWPGECESRPTWCAIRSGRHARQWALPQLSRARPQASAPL